MFTYLRTVCVCVSSFRAIFLIISTSIRNNPSTFFQNTYTIFVRFFIFFSVIFVKYLVMSYFGLIEAPQYYAQSQISFALTGLVAHANHMFYRFRTVIRVLYVIRPWYESCVRPVSPSDLVLVERPCVRFACALVVFVLYSKLSRHRFVIISLLSYKIHIRDSYELYQYGTQP